MAKRTRHDTFFRQMMQFPSFRQGFITFHAPAEVVAQVQLESLEPAPESLVRANKAILPDGVFRARLRHGSGWGYFVLEQETNPKPKAAARLLVAKGRILEYGAT